MVKKPTIDADYFKNPTALFRLIEERQWIEVVKQNERHTNECRQWVVKRDKDSGSITWRRLCMHEACIRQTTEEVIVSLLKNYPEAAKATDTYGRLPLHHACVHGAQERVIYHLLMAYPDSIDVTDVWGKTPLAAAQATLSGNKNQILELLQKKPSYFAVKVAEQFHQQVLDKQKAGLETLMSEQKEKYERLMEEQKNELFLIKEEKIKLLDWQESSKVTINTLEQKHDEGTKEIEYLMQSNKSLEKDLQDQKTMYSRLEESKRAETLSHRTVVEQLQQQIASYKSEVNSLQNKIESKCSEVSTLLDSEAKLIETVEEQNERYTELQKHHTIIATKLSGIENAISTYAGKYGISTESDFITIITNIEIKHDGIVKRLSNIEGDLIQTARSIVPSTVDTKEPKELLSRIEAEAKQIAQKFETLVHALNDYAARISVPLEEDPIATLCICEESTTVKENNSSKEIVRLSERVQVLESSKSELERTIAQMEEAKQSLDVSVAEKTSQSSKLQQRVKDLEKKNSILEQERASLKKDTESLTSDVLTLREKNASHESKSSNIVQQKDKLLQLYTDKIQGLNASKKELESKIRELKKELSEKAETLNEAKASLSTETMENEALKESIASITNRASTLEEKVIHFNNFFKSLDSKFTNLVENQDELLFAASRQDNTMTTLTRSNRDDELPDSKESYIKNVSQEHERILSAVRQQKTILQAIRSQKLALKMAAAEAMMNEKKNNNCLVVS